jgi:hypothetical protein
VSEFEKVECEPNLTNDDRAEKLYGVQKVDYEVEQSSQRQIDDFFREFSKYRVQLDLLQVLNDFHKEINQKYAIVLERFNGNVDWTDQHSYKPYFNKLQVTIL